MIKSIKNLVYYDLKYINSKRNIIFLYLIISSIIIFNLTSKMPPLIQSNVDLYGYIFMNSNLTMYVPCIISIYINALIFFDNELDSFVKIRIIDKRYWIISKVLSICLVNFIIISILTLLTLLIGCIFFKISINWNYDSILLANNIPMTVTDFKYTIFYSPLKLIFINSMIYVLFMSFLSLCCNIISLIFKLPKASLILPVIIILSSFILNKLPNVSKFKFFNPQSYILFGTRNYYNFGFLGECYLNFKQAVFIPFISLIILIFLGLIIIRRIDFYIGEKRLWN